MLFCKQFKNAPNSLKNIYTGWLVTGGTSGKDVIRREKRSRKYRIQIFRLRLCFREQNWRTNFYWTFIYGAILNQLSILKKSQVASN